MTNSIQNVNQFDPKQALDTWTQGLEQLTSNMKAAGFGVKNDPPGNPQQPYVHGAGGLLSPYGQDQGVFSSLLPGSYGLMTALPTVTPAADYFNNSLFGGDQADVVTVITGTTAGSTAFTDQKTAWCDDAPVAGLLKACSQYMPYGHYEMSIPEVNVPRLIQRLNRSEPTDLNVVNNWQALNNPFTPEGTMGASGQAINQELAVRWMLAALGFSRLVGQRGYVGSPANNSGAAQDMSGVDILYNTGKKDFFTGNLCAAADSLVYSFGNNNAATDTINGWYFYDYIEYFMRYLKDVALRAGLSNPQWVLTMRRDLFNVLTDNIALQRYARTVNQMLVLNNTTGYGGQVTVAGEQENAFRQAMRAGSFLPIDGENITVIVDDSITETFDPVTGENRSAVYFHPISANGMPITFWDYMTFNTSQVGGVLSKLNNAFAFTTDGGKFFWSQEYKNGCYKAQFESFTRIKCRATFLAARLTDVAYLPLIHSRSSNPAETSYFVNGGRTNAPMPAGFVDWSNNSVSIGNAN
jgi:hypothetical protein